MLLLMLMLQRLMLLLLLRPLLHHTLEVPQALMRRRISFARRNWVLLFG